METLHENAYWQCFCGFNSFQCGQILDATTLVKFRNRIGTEGMKQIEAFFLKTWSDMGLVKTKRVAVDTTAQPKNIAYPTDADLLHRIREKITGQVKRVRQEVALSKPFRTYSRSGKKQLLKIKKFYRKAPEERKEAIKELQAMTRHVVSQAGRIVNSLYSRGFKEAGKKLNRLVSLGQVIGTLKKNVGRAPQELTADRGFDQSLKKQENCRRRWGVKQLAIPKKGKTPHPNGDKLWFKKALKQRVKIEPVIGHLKSDHAGICRNQPLGMISPLDEIK